MLHRLGLALNLIVAMKAASQHCHHFCSSMLSQKLTGQTGLSLVILSSMVYEGAGFLNATLTFCQCHNKHELTFNAKGGSLGGLSNTSEGVELHVGSHGLNQADRGGALTFTQRSGCDAAGRIKRQISPSCVRSLCLTTEMTVRTPLPPHICRPAGTAAV